MSRNVTVKIRERRRGKRMCYRLPVTYADAANTGWKLYDATVNFEKFLESMMQMDRIIRQQRPEES